MAGATAPPVTPKSTVNLGPLYQQATAQAQAAVQPQIDALNQQMAGSDASAKQQALDAQNAGDAASSLISSLISPVNGAYQSAAQNQELAANGFSQGLQDALKGNTDNLNKTLASVNSPATLDSHASEAGDLLNSIGGFNPGTTFAKQGASAAAGLAGTASSANLLGLENAKSVRAQALVTDQGFQQKIANLAATLPGQIETNYEKLQSLALSDAKFAEQVKNDQFNQAAKTAASKLAVAKFNTSTQLSIAKMNQQARQFAVRQSNADRTYALSLAHLGIAQKNLQMKIAANAFTQAHGGYSASQVRGFNQKLDALVSTAAPTHPIATTVTGGSPSGTMTGSVEPTPQYRDTSGKWHDITPTSVIPKNAPTRNTSTYGNFITAALKKGVPIQLALQRADSIWPETQRDIPDSLKNLPAVANEAAQQASDYSQMTGSPQANGRVTLATGPQGQRVTLQMPKNVTPAIKGIVDGAVEYLGTPYAWGGSSPTGFDCSGLAQYLYAKVGVQIPRTTYDQFQSGTSVPKGQLQAGDLVFFKGSDSKGGLPGHVGIYVGNGQMIDAPHTGDVVRVQSVSSFGGYQGARRYTK